MSLANFLCSQPHPVAHYQVKIQLGVFKIESAYFVVWTEKDLHIEQIMFDEVLWNTICEKSKHIFVTSLDNTIWPLVRNLFQCINNETIQ
jgi:hypothetical protein